MVIGTPNDCVCPSCFGNFLLDTKYLNGQNAAYVRRGIEAAGITRHVRLLDLEDRHDVIACCLAQATAYWYANVEALCRYLLPIGYVFSVGNKSVTIECPTYTLLVDTHSSGTDDVYGIRELLKRRLGYHCGIQQLRVQEALARADEAIARFIAS